MSIQISQLFIYPVKSLAGIALKNSTIDDFGLMHDRRWMVVDEHGQFLSQRSHPKMALIKTSINAAGILSLHCNGDTLEVPEANSEHRMSVQIWNDQLEAFRIDEATDQWLSKHLKLSCHLVYMPDPKRRSINDDFATARQTHVPSLSFADAFPILLLSQASLDDLNQRLLEKGHHMIDVRHFRPNVVVTGCDAFAEDQWQSIAAPGIKLSNLKRCDRCILTTVNPDTGTRESREPLATLAQYRMHENKVYFGINLALQHTLESTTHLSLNVGDTIRLN